MKVNKDKAMTPDEEFSYILEQMCNVPDYIPWEVHPNKLRAADIRLRRLWEKRDKLVASAEFIEYNPFYSL